MKAACVVLLLWLRCGAALRVGAVPKPSLRAPALLQRAGLAASVAVAIAKPTAAFAAAAATAAVPHMKIGEKVATYLRSTGVPDAAIIAMIAAMPVVELRGAIPVGCIMGVPLPKVFLLSVLGNMIPVLPLILALRAPVVQRILAKPLSKARRLSSDVLGDGKARWTALAAFVGVPFPGTGAWTGAMIAFVLGIPLFEGVSAIFVGVVSAGLIVSALARAGAKGAVVAVGGIVAIYAAQQLTASKK